MKRNKLDRGSLAHGAGVVDKSHIRSFGPLYILCTAIIVSDKG